MTIRCCKCGKRTRKFTQVCESCGHRFCKLCKGGTGFRANGLSALISYFQGSTLATISITRHIC